MRLPIVINSSWQFLAESHVLGGITPNYGHPFPNLYYVRPCAQWRREQYGRYGGLHTNLKFGMAAPYKRMAAPYKPAKIWGVDFQENHKNCCHQMPKCTKIDFGWGPPKNPLEELVVLPQVP